MPETPDPSAASHPAALAGDPVGDEIAELCAHIDAAQYRLLTLLRRTMRRNAGAGGAPAPTG